MSIYYTLIGFWAIGYTCIDTLKQKINRVNWRIISILFISISLFVVMALRHYTVGIDIKQYLYRYNYLTYPLDYSIFSMKEWGFHGLSAIIKNLGIGNQGYIAFISLIIIILHARFFYKYSPNLFFSYYLYLTIGLFSLSLSGLMQSISIGLILISFDYILKDKPLGYLLCIAVAYTFHESAIWCLPLYLLRNIKINRNRGTILLFLVAATLIAINPMMKLMKLIVPSQYSAYLLTENSNPANPLVILVALSITAFCLFFMNRYDDLDDDTNKLVSLLLIMSLINALINVLSFDISIISRMAFYFVPYNLVLIPVVINRISNKGSKYIAFILILFLSLLQFIISMPGANIQIDNYMFFWESTGYI